MNTSKEHREKPGWTMPPINENAEWKPLKDNELSKYFIDWEKLDREEELIADAIGLNMTLEEIETVIKENDKK